MEIPKQSTVAELSLQFSLLLLDFSEKLGQYTNGNIVNQMLRSGTSIGAMIREAQGAESRKDFVHKLKIAYKEAEETEYWLLLLSRNSRSEKSEVLKGTLTRVKQMLGKILSSCARERNLGK